MMSHLCILNPHGPTLACNVLCGATTLISQLAATRETVCPNGDESYGTNQHQ